jgi:hypothetical protein
VLIKDYDIFEDTGCNEATRFLGRQSKCLSCPFDECKEDKLERVYRLYNNPLAEGYRGAMLELLELKNTMTFKDLAEVVGVSLPTIYRYYKKAKELN